MIKEIINEHIKVSETLSDHYSQIENISKLCLEAVKNKNKIILCGNGGSASDCIHIAAELVGKFEKDRKGLPAIALTANQSNLTAIGNDYGFDNVFSRQIEAIGTEKDVLIALSTSGNSKNIIESIKLCQTMNIDIVALTGKNGGEIATMDCFESIKINSNNTARIQEMHIIIGHIICAYIESNI